jgi:hypothetical protein
MSDDRDKNERGDLFSRAVKAGKRTYFFDVRSTLRNDYYLTITESKKRFGNDGRLTFEKHKIFLYKEDFQKFIDGLQEAVDHIRENAPEPDPSMNHSDDSANASDVSFDDL